VSSSRLHSHANSWGWRVTWRFVPGASAYANHGYFQGVTTIKTEPLDEIGEVLDRKSNLSQF